MQRLFSSDLHFIAQNGKFDIKHIHHAIDTWIGHVEDTMLLHHAIDERQGTHGLKTQAYVYTGMGGYDTPLEDYKGEHPEADPEKGGSYARIPGEILFKYAAMDADVTMRCRNSMRESDEFLRNERIQTIVDEFSPAISDSLARMEWDGARVDAGIIRSVRVQLTEQMGQISRDIAKLPEVRQYQAKRLEQERAKRKTDRGKARVKFEFNPGSDDQVKAVLFDHYGLRPAELTDGGLERLVERMKVRNDGKKIKDQFTWEATVHDAIDKREWKLFSCKADVLHEYERAGNDLSELILRYRDLETLNGTFVNALLDKLDEEEYVHGTYLVHGTVTARLASRDPNLQNIPNKDGGRVKRAYISRFGDEGVLMQADYSQVELRVAASWFDEPTMIQAYIDGLDLHTLTAMDIAGLDAADFDSLPAHTDDQRGKKDWRTRAKRINFGVLYGGGPPALVSTLKKDGVFISVDDAQALIDRYFEVRPGLKRGITELEKRVSRNGYAESFTGRRRRVPEVFSENNEVRSRALRQIVNFPIQSGASDMTLMSLVLIERELRAQGLRSKVILTVHDSVIFDCHVDEVYDVAEIAKTIMENIMHLSDEVFPGIDWSWLKCPIRADLEAGFTWGSLVDFDVNGIDTGKVVKSPWVSDDDDAITRPPCTTDELWDQMTWKMGKISKKMQEAA